LLSASIVSCGSDEESVSGSGSPGGWGGGAASSGDGGGAAGSDGSTAGSAGWAQPDAGGGCKTSADCDGGVCVAGSCCPSAKQACASACCKPSETCFASACVVPGKACHSNADCASNQYCEPALGDGADAGPGDSGAAGAAGAGGASADAGPKDGGKDASEAGPKDAGGADGASPVCLAPAPLAGRCLELPPKCPATDAGTPPPDAGACIPACEYHPPAGLLNPVPKWTWGPVAAEYANFTDIWSTPAIGRAYDSNCDGKVDLLDAPVVVFVSGAVAPSNTPRDNGVLRMLDGRSGQEIWSLRRPSAGSKGFMGFSVAIGDVDADGRMDIVAVSGEGLVVLVRADGKVMRTSDKPIPGAGTTQTGWGGGVAIADMDGDGFPEIGFGAAVFSTTGAAITRKWVGSSGTGGGDDQELSTFVDLDGAADDRLELLAGRTAYKSDGTILWDRTDLPDGFPAVGDFDQDGNPEVVLVAKAKVWILDGASGATVLGPATLPGPGHGGPPTVADFDGDGKPEIGVAQDKFYSVLEPSYATNAIDLLWKAANHDLSSSVTGSSVFDFEGDGKAEVIYGDECFLWVYDGTTGKVLFATPHTSFTATEASLVADIDGDGHAEILMVSNGADPSAAGWACDVAPWNAPDPATGRPAWKPPQGAKAYRGLVAFGDKSNGWVGTRTLWNQHTYHVTNICDERDSACAAPNVYGSIPKSERRNWKLGWLNNFRQNVQDKGIFDAPDATVTLKVDCTTPPTLRASVRNLGLALLPAGVKVGFYVRKAGVDTLLGTASTAQALFPGQVQVLTHAVSMGATLQDVFVAKIIVDPLNPTFHECRDDNNDSGEVKAQCQSVQ
jgi:hypothetical protein